ncbi:MAG: gamma-glutamyl-gamma-aminobutyrate hydrolase family protein, partial [Bacteroidota bacterium]
QGLKPNLTWVNSETFEKDPASLKTLSDFDGIIVPGGFGERGIEGIISAIRYAREKKIPYLGLCYGMQLACIEFARNVVGLKDASSTEIKPKTKDPVIHLNPLQARNVTEKKYGATMRLGSYSCDLMKGTKSFKAYGEKTISERHRHRYEFNNEYREQLEKAGLIIAGVNPEQDLVEIIELPDHPFFVGVQFHPEFQSQPLNPHPLFKAFVKAAMKK